MNPMFDNTSDDDFRVITKKNCDTASSEQTSGGNPKRRWGLLLAFLALLAIASICVVMSLLPSDEENSADEKKVFEPELQEVQDTADVTAESVVRRPFSTCSDTVKTAFTEVLDKTANDVEMLIFIPHNATPRLRVGEPLEKDLSIVFATQAADLRADNGKIVGAFVCAGEPLSWGLSKKGFCSVIDSVVTIGMSENSPLFEEATEKGGYFFRQYALVSNGRMVYNNLRNKSERKALCKRGDEVFVAVTKHKESMHDFALALVDMGVDNAIYLVGSRSYFFFRDKEGTCKPVYGRPKFSRTRSRYTNVNYIEWVAKN